MLNLKSIVIRTYIKQELFTYFTLVPVLVYFVLFSFDFHLVSLSQFILFLSIAIITTLGSGILFKYLSYKRVMNYYNQMDKSNKNQISILKSKIFEMSTFDSQTAFIRWLVIAGSTFVSPMYIFLGAEIHELVLLIILFFSNGLVSIPIYYLISESGLIKAHKFPIFNGIEFSKDRHEIPIMIKLQSSILISVLYPVIIFSTFILYSVLDLIDLGDIFIGFIILVVASALLT